MSAELFHYLFNRRNRYVSFLKVKPIAIVMLSILSFGQVYGQAEIDVKGNSTSIADGDATPSTVDNTDFGSVNSTGGVMHKTFVIENTGSSSLSLSGTPIVSISGTNSADFTVVKQPSSSVAANGKDTFIVKFSAGAQGTRSATISIANNDANENPYNFSIQGTGAIIPSDLSAQLGGDIDGEARNDRFGSSVSTSSDGKRVAIGAPSNSGNGNIAGHTRIYEYNSTTGKWVQLGSDIDGEKSPNENGYSVSLSSDGNRVAIGEHRSWDNGAYAGQVRVFEYNSSTNKWNQMGPDIDGEAAGDHLGHSVSLNSDGTRLAVGAPHNKGSAGTGFRNGHARIYEYNSSTSSWNQLGADIDSEAGGDYNGYSISINDDGNRVAIGAIRNNGNGLSSGSVRIFEYSTVSNSWSQLGGDIDGAKAKDGSGFSVSMSSDGYRVAIGSPDNNDGGQSAGHVRIFGYDVNQDKWTQLGSAIEGDNTGYSSGLSVSMSADGSRVVIGSPNLSGTFATPGQAGIFQYNNTSDKWTQVAKTIVGEDNYNLFGYSVSMNTDGSRVIIGATYASGIDSFSGHVRVYELQNSPPEIAIKGGGTEISSGSTTFSDTNNTDFSSVDTTATASISKTFYVLNTDSGSLSLTGNPIVVLSGTGSANFSVTTQPSSTIAFGDSSAFVISFDPDALGTSSVNVSIANNDADENPYTFAIRGTGELPSLLPKRSATDRVIIDQVNTSARDWGRGFQFKPKEPIIVTDLGGRMLTTDTFHTAIWDVDNEIKLATLRFDPTTAGSYEYVALTTPLLLESGKNYAITAYGDQTGYYFGNSSQINEFIEFGGMRFCNSCSKTQAFPDRLIGNFHYGLADFLFLRASMLVAGNGNVVAPGGISTDTTNYTHFDSVFVNDSKENTYYAYNPVEKFEDTVLVTGTPKVSITGTDASEFKITQQIGVDTLFGLDSSMFKIEFTPSDTGYKEAMVNITYTDSLNGARTYSFKISGVGKRPAFSVSFNIDSSISCNGVSDGQITATVAGTRPFTYLWSNSATDSFISNIGAGTYTLRIIDANQDTLIDSISITEPSKLAVSAVVDSNVTCNGFTNGGATATATGGTMPYSYAWSNSGTTVSLNGVGAGTYSIIVTDKNGCTDSTGATITQPDSLKFNVTYLKDISCFGANDGEFGYAITGGTAPYSETRGAIDVTDTFTGFTPTTNEKLYLSDANGCMDSSTAITIIEPAALVVSVAVDSNVTCNGEATGGLTATASGGTSTITYAWSNSATTASISSIVAGTYEVIVQDANGCRDTADNTITEPAKLMAGSITGDDVVCSGAAPNKITELSTASGGTGSLSYQWQMSSDNTSWSDISGTNSSEYQPAGTAGNTWYRRLATDANSCGPFASDTVQITINSQPSASFTANSACEDQQTFLTDQSTVTGGSIKSYNWSFGDKGTSNQQNPINVYKNSGSYTVSLVVTTDSGCVDSASTTLSVNAMPSVDFSATAACEGTATTFTNKASIATGKMTYDWNLGDNNSSTIAAPSHSYTNAGYYTVQLIATSDSGCVDSISKTVQVKNIAKPNFSATAVCEGNFTNFTNLTVGGSTYSWDFADGTGDSKQANPKNKYKNSGNYTVVLTATSTDGCSDTAQRVVNVYSLPTSSFTASEECLGTATDFTNNSSGASSYQWIFGNGTSSSDASPSVVYAKDGNYKVELTATTANGCTDVSSSTIKVNALPKVAFTTADICLSENLSTTNTTTGAASYAWNFGDGNTSKATAPTHTYSVFGNYRLSLVATSSKGCIDSAATTVNAFAVPEVSFTAADVCFGGSTNFSNSSKIADGTMTYVWDLGDGTSTGNPSPSYGYATAGAYAIKLVATSNNGCKDSTTGSVDVYAMPAVDFSTASVCYGDTLFTNNTSSVASYSWSFGDGNTSSDASPFNFYGTSGDYTVQLTATTTNNCIDSLSKSISIYSKPEADFDAKDVCDETAVQFANSSYNAIITSNSWDFGDGTIDNRVNPSNLYTIAGDYTTTLIVTSNEGCADTLTKTITVHPNPEMDFVSTIECDYDATLFTDNSKISLGSISYIWDFGTGDTSSLTSPQYQFPSAGAYKVTLTGTSDMGCTRETSSVVMVNPSPLASLSANNHCEGIATQITSLSSVSSGSIAEYNWSLGDGNISSSAATSHLYGADGDYTVELIVKTYKSCYDTASTVVTVYNKPTAGFNTPDICFGELSAFTDASTDANEYLYNFGDKWGISTIGAPEYTYEAPGTYDATLFVTSVWGCKDTLTKSVTVYDLPTALFNVNNHCFGEDFSPQDNSAGDLAVWSWNYDDGNSGNGTAPVHAYGKDGSYSVKLEVEDDNGCIDSLRKTVVVWPLPKVGIRSDTLVSKGYTVPMLATGGVEYKWSPVDNLDKPLQPAPIATVVEDVTYTVTVANEFGCIRDTFVNLRVEDDYTLEPSNIMTPDGNGQNDNWIVEKAQYYNDVHVIVFDRWGRVVYQNTSYDNSWNGISATGDDLPDGAYYYVVVVPAEREEYKGSITIFR